MRLISFITASVLSSLAFASPLSNINNNNETPEVVPRATCNDAHLAIFNEDIKYGVPFCQFWDAIERSRSPVPSLKVQDVSNVCKCILDGQFQPAAKVGDKSKSRTPKTVTKTVTVARTTARSVPIRTTGVSTVIQKSTVTVAKTTVTVGKITVTARPTNAGKASTVTIAKTTITAKASGAAAKPSTVTVAKTTVTKKSTVTVAKTTITANNNVNAGQSTKVQTVTLSAVGSSNAAKSTVTVAKSTVTVAKSTVTRKSTVTVAKSTITVAKSTVTRKSTVTVAQTTITAKNAAAQTTMVKTVTLSAVGSGQKTVTATRQMTVTAQASNAAQSTVTSVRTVTSVKTVSAKSTATRTVTSVRTVGAQSPATVTSVVTVTNVQTQTATQAGAAVTSSSPNLGSGSSSASNSDSVTASGASSAAASTTTSNPRSTCSLAPSSTPPSSITVADTEYERFYRGCGFTENPQNPGSAYFSDNFPAVTNTFNSSVTATDAVQQCAMDAFYRYDDPNQYLSFDLHFISTSGQGAAGEGGEGYWECVQYFSEQSDVDASPYFNVPNPNVTIAYGYSSGLYSDAAAVAAQQNSKRAVLENSPISESSHFHPAGRGQRLTGNFTLSALAH